MKERLISAVLATTAAVLGFYLSDADEAARANRPDLDYPSATIARAIAPFSPRSKPL